MESTPRVRRFTLFDRFTHLFLILTFMVLAVTGAARAFMTTDWGDALLWLLGGYDAAATIHIWAGWLMTGGFVVHIVVVLARVDWRRPRAAFLGPDSLVPKWRDLREFGQRIRWSLGLGEPPSFERWTYLEKFDYWAVFWGIPLLFVTGIMLIYPVETSRLLPGWTLNVAALLHRAEAVLAVLYIVIVHLLFGHFRRSTFPLNETMFSGSVETEELRKEKPEWLQRLKDEGRLALLAVRGPVLWFRTLYLMFAYAVVAVGLYLVIFGTSYSRYISIH